MGEATKEIYLAYQRRINGHIKIDTAWFRSFESAKTIQINDITVTPFTVDHSTYDAHMFLVEANGRRILHTGDFRTHGFRGKGVLPTLRKYFGQVDVLIIQGTNLYKDDEEIITEHQLQRKAMGMLKQYKYIFVICPSTNIDRIASFNAATSSVK
jgi:ribonuclease J